MNKFKKNSKKNNKTRKNHHRLKVIGQSFEQEITVIFLETLLMIKLFHWKTHSYATHKATDELYTKLNGNIDTFIEVLLGKTGVRTDLTSKQNIKLIDLTNSEALKREVDNFKSYLVGLNSNKALKTMTNSDLFNIRDEILGDMNQFLYLLTFTQ